MREPTDALRSLKRYVALALGDGWEVRLSGERGTFHRPYARVGQIPTLSFVSESWHTSRVVGTYQVATFPLRMASPDESQMEGNRVANLLWVAFVGPGVDLASAPTRGDSVRGHPMRVPLYDYAAVPLRGQDAFASEGDRNPSDFMKVEAPPEVTVQMNPDDELLWSVAANIRMSWLRSAAVPSSAPMTVSVQVEASEHGD